jgi:hypothetical protein
MNARELLKLTLLALTAVPPPILAQNCGNPPGPGVPWTVGDAVLFASSKLNVDADGAPNSYLLDGKGLSYTCDGVVALENGKRITPKSNPADWQQKCNAAWALARERSDYGGVAIFGFQTDSNNRPLVQAEGDPLPGKAYISSTSVRIPGMPDGTQRRYVDALKIPYLVLPSSFTSKYKVKPGSVAVVYRKKTDAHAFAVFADSGDLGEASVKLHQDLGSKPIVQIAGVDRAKSRIEDAVLVAVFPGNIAPPMADAVAWTARIKQEGEAALQSFGGIERIRACAK